MFLGAEDVNQRLRLGKHYASERWIELTTLFSRILRIYLRNGWKSSVLWGSWRTLTIGRTFALDDQPAISSLSSSKSEMNGYINLVNDTIVNKLLLIWKWKQISKLAYYYSETLSKSILIQQTNLSVRCRSARTNSIWDVR